MSTLESYGGSWIISMEKEHELYLRKVKRDKWKVRAIRILDFSSIYCTMGNCSAIKMDRSIFNFKS